MYFGRHKDECHRYLLPDHPCTVEITNTIKEMRSKETSTVLITQDPKALPGAVLRHMTVTVLHRIKSAEALGYLARHVAAFAAEQPAVKARNARMAWPPLSW